MKKFDDMLIQKDNITRRFIEKTITKSHQVKKNEEQKFWVDVTFNCNDFLIESKNWNEIYIHTHIYIYIITNKLYFSYLVDNKNVYICIFFIYGLLEFYSLMCIIFLFIMINQLKKING